MMRRVLLYSGSFPLFASEDFGAKIFTSSLWTKRAMPGGKGEGVQRGQKKGK